MHTGSPASRLARNRPPSTTGDSASITARMRPSPGGADTGAKGAGALTRLRGSLSELAPGAALLLLSAMRFEAQPESRQRRERQVDRFDAPVSAHGHRFHGAEAAPAGASIFVRVAIQDLAPYAPMRHAHQEIGARDGREVTCHEHRRAAARSIVARLAQEGDDAALGIVDVEPLESIRAEVNPVERGLAAVHAIQIPHQPLHASMLG